MTFNIIERYIAKTVLSSMLLVSIMLVGLQIFIVFVNQLDDIGKGDYTLWAALRYVLMDMPYQVYLFFPMASLMGTLIGLGVLANHHELVVMRASGMSIANVMFAVFKASILFILGVTLLGETFVPHFSRYAADLKLTALTSGQSLRTGMGVWVRSGNDMIYIERVMPHQELHGIDAFHFNPSHQLVFARHIERAKFLQGQWVAYGVMQTKIEKDKTVASRYAQLNWPLKIDPAVLQISGNEPDEMTMPELYRYLEAQKRNHQSALNFELAFWQRIMQPFASIVMMVLAIPFIFGPLRSATLGSRLITGATVGFGFHLINRFFGPMSQVFQFSPVVAAVMPTLLFALIAVYFLKRVR